MESSQDYYHTLNGFDVLTPEEETELFIVIQNSTGQERATAIDTALKRNLRLVVSIARHYTGYGVPLDDIVQEGNIGLLYAIKKFDINKGFRFSTYAVWWIKQYCSSAIHKYGKIIRMSTNTTRDIYTINKYIKSFKSMNGREPSTQEIADGVGFTQKKVKGLIQFRFNSKIYSLDAPMAPDSNESRLDTIPSDNIDPTEIILNEQISQQIRDLLTRILTEKERKIIEMRFGLDINYNDELTLQEIGEEFKLTRERIRQIINKVLQKLRMNEQTRTLI